MIRFSLLTGLVAALFLGGCRRRSSEEEQAAPAETAAPPVAKKEDPAAQAEKVLADFQRRIRSISDPKTKRTVLRTYLENLKALEAQAGKPLPALARMEAEAKTVEKEIEDAALAAFARFEEKVEKEMEKVVAGEAIDYSAAHALVEKAPIEEFKGSSAEVKLEDLKARINRYESADMEFESRKAKLNDIRYEDPAKCVALLAGFPPQFDDTPYAAKARELLEDYYRKYAESREARAAARKAITFEELPVGTYFPLQPDSDYPIEYDDGEKVLTIGPNKEDYEKKDEIGTWVSFGSSESPWVDVELQFQAQVTGGDKISFGARGRERSGGGYSINWAGIGGLEIADEEWHDLTVRIEGRDFEIIDATGKKTVREDIRSGAGTFVIRVTGDKASIKMRNLKVAALDKPEAGSEGEEAEGEEGEGKKAEGEKEGKGEEEGAGSE